MRNTDVICNLKRYCCHYYKIRKKNQISKP